MTITDPTTSSAPSAPLGHTLGRVLLRRWYAVLLPLLVVPAAAFFLSHRQSPTYEARAQIIVSRPELASLILGVALPTDDPVRRIDTAQQLATTRTVAVASARRLGLPPSRAGSITGMLDVHSNSQSDLLTFAARSSSPKLSMRVANAAAAATVALRQALETRGIDRLREQATKALGTSVPGSPTALAARAELDRLATLEDLADTEAVVVEHASSAAQVAPQPRRAAELGLGLAIVLGIALAYLVEALDGRVRSVAELGSILRLPIVGEIPTMRTLRRRASLLIPVRDTPLSVATESFRYLETNLAISLASSNCRSVLITSVGRSEGKTMTAVNFALSAAETGKRVFLLDLNLRHPRLGSAIGRPGAIGVAEIIRGTATAPEVLIELAVPPAPGAGTAERRLSAMVAGHDIRNPMHYLHSAAVAAIVRDAREAYDLVVIDAPPLFGSGDAMTISTLVDCVLLVVDYRRAKRSVLAELVEVAEHLPSSIIGAVINRGPRRSPTPPQAHGRRVDEQKRRIAVAA